MDNLNAPWGFKDGEEYPLPIEPERTMINEISIDHQGNMTVIGVLAHQLWQHYREQIPAHKCSANNFYVLESPLQLSTNWEIKAGQTTRYGAMKYMTPMRVLVDVLNAPKSLLDVYDRELAEKLDKAKGTP